MAKYQHDQSVAATTWSITHNLGRKPVFDVLVDIGGNLTKVFPEYVEYVSDDVIELTFSTAYAGKTILSTFYSPNPDQTPPPAGDPYWSYVSLLSHFNGANNSTTFIDEKGHSIYGYGGAKISTAQSKFGGSSLYLDGIDDYLSIPYTVDLIPDADFTIEAFVYLTSYPTTWAILYAQQSSTNIAPISVQINSLGHIRFSVSSNNLNYGFSLTSDNTISLNIWTHVSITRTGEVWRIFKDGQIESIGINSITPYNNTNQHLIGRQNGIYYVNGYIDEFRFTKGYARYTSNFTPPIAEFPNS